MADTRLATHPDEFERLDPLELRRRYVVEDLFAPGELRFCLSQQDRVLLARRGRCHRRRPTVPDGPRGHSLRGPGHNDP